MLIVSTDAFRAFADAAARLEPCPLTGVRDPDQFKVLAAEILDVWPASLYADLSDETRTLTLGAAVEVLRASRPIGGGAVVAGA